MGRIRIFVLLATCFMVAGVNECPGPTVIDQKVVIKRVECLKTALSGKELMVINTNINALVVKAPSEKLKKFLSDAKEGDVMLLTAIIDQNGADVGIFNINEIVLLPGGEKYRP